TLNFTDFSATYPTGMSGGAADPLDPDGSKSAFMELQSQGAPAPHQPYPLRAPYQPVGAQGHEGPPGFQQGPRGLGAYPFPIQNGPLHNSYATHPTHPYLGSYPGGPCGPCPSPPRDGEWCPSSFCLPLAASSFSRSGRCVLVLTQPEDSGPTLESVQSRRAHH
ncbi:unnamed protein product, partial [Ixodes persulcatus]